mmetsp:Transcript_81881/g.226960  ORF Transcript_81881/g.226960 Transcript_81881/m.226960 type:complete len:270 (+) Transcript_81881:1387-2196(+)
MRHTGRLGLQQLQLCEIRLTTGTCTHFRGTKHHGALLHVPLQRCAVRLQEPKLLRLGLGLRLPGLIPACLQALRAAEVFRLPQLQPFLLCLPVPLQLLRPQQGMAALRCPEHLLLGGQELSPEPVFGLRRPSRRWGESRSRGLGCRLPAFPVQQLADLRRREAAENVMEAVVSGLGAFLQSLCRGSGRASSGRGRTPGNLNAGHGCTGNSHGCGRGLGSLQIPVPDALPGAVGCNHDPALGGLVPPDDLHQKVIEMHVAPQTNDPRSAA